jgi:hypothetical protein
MDVGEAAQDGQSLVGGEVTRFGIRLAVLPGRYVAGVDTSHRKTSLGMTSAKVELLSAGQ